MGSTGSAERRRRFGVETSLAFRIQLDAGVRECKLAPNVREVPPEDVGAVLSATSGLSPQEVARIAPGPVRVFVVESDGEVVHHSCVGYAVQGPLLFLCWTVPRARGRGHFGRALRFVVATLAAEGEPFLRSSCAASNVPSVRAHRAAGFEVVRYARRPFAFGVDLRRTLRRWVRRLTRWS